MFTASIKTAKRLVGGIDTSPALVLAIVRERDMHNKEILLRSRKTEKLAIRTSRDIF